MKIIHESERLIIGQADPCVRSVYHKFFGRVDRYRISFPYMIFMFRPRFVEKIGVYDKGILHLFVTQKPWKPKDNLYYMELPNVSPHNGGVGTCGWTCFAPLAMDTFELGIADFWHSSFTYSVTNKYPEHILQDWHDKTADDAHYWEKERFRYVFPSKLPGDIYFEIYHEHLVQEQQAHNRPSRTMPANRKTRRR